MVTIREAAEHLAVSRWWLYEKGDAHGVPCYRVGKGRRYLLTELTKWARAQRRS